MDNKIKKNRGSDISIFILMFAGILLLITAGVMPFKIRDYYKPIIDNYNNISDIGAIGDFIGGTTVAFLTASSVLLLLATIVMQRKEIKISQQSIKELVKQTESSVTQAKEARKETQLTNRTMKRQQFETTFFNMINLHHSILESLKLNDASGRLVFPILHEKLKNVYYDDVFSAVKTLYVNKVVRENDDELKDLITQIYIEKQLSTYISEFYENASPDFDNEGNYISFSQEEIFYEKLNSNKDRNWIKRKRDAENYLTERVFTNESLMKNILSDFDFINKSDNERIEQNKLVLQLRERIIKNPTLKLKAQAYQRFFKKEENSVGHYYRNLYRIIKIINEEELDNSEKRKYIGIIRAQLSSIELNMLFNNIVYSEKGSKFKELLKNYRFFDDHLNPDDYIWRNDLLELEKINQKPD